MEGPEEATMHLDSPILQGAASSLHLRKRALLCNKSPVDVA